LGGASAEVSRIQKLSKVTQQYTDRISEEEKALSKIVTVYSEAAAAQKKLEEEGAKAAASRHQRELDELRKKADAARAAGRASEADAYDEDALNKRIELLRKLRVNYGALTTSGSKYGVIANNNLRHLEVGNLRYIQVAANLAHLNKRRNEEIAIAKSEQREYSKTIKQVEELSRKYPLIAEAMDKNNLSYDELLSKLKAVDAASKQVKANMAAEAKAEAKAAEKTAKLANAANKLRVSYGNLVTSGSKYGVIATNNLKHLEAGNLEYPLVAANLAHLNKLRNEEIAIAKRAQTTS
jgi:hypothetical protein